MGRFGFDLLEDQAADHARRLVQDTREEIAGDSEIEKLLALAMVCRGWLGVQEHYCIGQLNKDESLPVNANKMFIYYKQQVQIAEVGRVDFVIYAYDFGPRILKAPGWRTLIVECDGHDFHERTKEQAKRDRSRDRRATLGGQEVMRFTGSEIWNAPWGCAGEIMEWASRSFG